MIHRSQDRHNRDDASIHRAVSVLDKVRQRGGDRKSEEAKTKSKARGCAIDSKSSSQTAAALGVSPRKVEQARQVAKHEDLDKAVRQGGPVADQWPPTLRGVAIYHGVIIVPADEAEPST
jgi:hypothetical protein